MSDPFPAPLRSLWAPWRVEYFRSGLGSADFLAEAAASSDDAAHLVIARGKSAFLMMNRFPYAVGHMMSVPYRKVADLGDLSAREQVELFAFATRAQALLRRVAGAQGFNIRLNIGACSGAGVPDHLHLHIVPRWNGDTNFMPVLGSTRVMPEALDAMYAKLLAADRELANPAPEP